VNILVPLADGFEEVEAVTIIDVLRRAGLTVKTASVTASTDVKGSHGIVVRADSQLSMCDPTGFDAIALPGGPGTKNLRDSAKVLECITTIHAGGGVCAAICAAPTVLACTGILKDRKVTCFPGDENSLNGGIYTGSNVEVDGRIVTGKSAGTALVFSLMLVKVLLGAGAASKLKSGMYSSMDGLDF